MVDKNRFLTDTHKKLITFFKGYVEERGYTNVKVKSAFIGEEDLPLEDGDTLLCIYPLPSIQAEFIPMDWELREDVYHKLNFSVDIATDFTNQVFINDLFAEIYFLVTVVENDLQNEGIYTADLGFAVPIEPDGDNITRITSVLSVIV